MNQQYTRPDFSQFVVHFTKDAAPFGAASEPAGAIKDIGKLSARERLFAMLESGNIHATRMPWTNRPAICFTECTWGGLLYHSRQYSPFGIGFSKAYLFSRGGAPAIYLTPGLLEHQRNHAKDPKYPFEPQLYAFVTPFMPGYAPKAYKEKFWKKDKDIDYTHEREWRVPHDLDFDLKHIEFVIVSKYEDMAKAPAKFKDAIGRDKWLIMENYRKIEELWPLHHVPEA
ncbi:MAG: hypothetical protein PCFJNLEI_04130 [Verrucomicrobiae bacterium]|nr:hypothetical protein [Verrucomicrobiae bacterium]